MERLMKRVYIYEELYHKIMMWGSKKVNSGELQRQPNYKENFPYYFEKYMLNKSD